MDEGLPEMDHADWQRMLEEERERQLADALDECLKRGVPQKHLLTLIFETQARWMPDRKAA